MYDRISDSQLRIIESMHANFYWNHPHILSNSVSSADTCNFFISMYFISVKLGEHNKLLQRYIMCIYYSNTGNTVALCRVEYLPERLSHLFNKGTSSIYLPMYIKILPSPHRMARRPCCHIVAAQSILMEFV